jgi:hypothetical protein
MMDWLQLHIAIAMAASVIAYLLWGRTWSSLAAFVLLWGALEYAISTLIRRLVKSRQKEATDFQKSLDSVDLATARSRADEGLRTSRGCSTVESEASETGARGLPQDLRRVFSRYRQISFDTGDVLKLGNLEGDYVEIGSTFDGARILLRLKDSTIFEWEAEGLPAIDVAPHYPSLPHWIMKTIEFSEQPQ